MSRITKSVMAIGVLFTCFLHAENNEPLQDLEKLPQIRSEDPQIKEEPLQALDNPKEVFYGMYCSLGLGYEKTWNDYEGSIFDELAVLVKGKTKTLESNSFKVSSDSKVKRGNGMISATLGFGDVFRDVYYLGVEFEAFYRFKGSTKSNDQVTLKAKSTMGVNPFLRFGYVFHDPGLMVYGIIGARRDIQYISFTNSVLGRAVLDETGKLISVDGKYKGYTFKKPSGAGSFGSFHPSVGLGLEKKLRDNWSIRCEAAYTFGVWDDGNKYVYFPAEEKDKDGNTLYLCSKFKAKGNRATIRVMLSKYF